MRSMSVGVSAALPRFPLSGQLMPARGVEVACTWCVRPGPRGGTSARDAYARGPARSLSRRANACRRACVRQRVACSHRRRAARACWPAAPFARGSARSRSLPSTQPRRSSSRRMRAPLSSFLHQGLARYAGCHGARCSRVCDSVHSRRPWLATQRARPRQGTWARSRRRWRCLSPRRRACLRRDHAGGHPGLGPSRCGCSRGGQGQC